jgi:membrane protein involved in colicin uptake
MSESLSLNGEERNKNIGLIVSAIVHLLLTLLCFINAFNYYDPPPPPVAGIVVSLGIPDEEESLSEELAASELSELTPSNSSDEPSETKDPTNSDIEPEASKIESSTTVTKSDVVAKSKSDVKTKPKGPSAEEIALQTERDRIAKAKAEKAKAEASKKAELDKSKQKFSDILGKGKGSANQGGNKGDPEGDSNAKVLDNLSKGSGSIGAGLGNRSVVFEPTISESSQKTGKVVVVICINSKGKVISAKYTQSGSTTTDAKLVRIAERAAKKYVFTESATPEQCGNVVIEFKVR